MKALIITLITAIVLSQLGISVGASSENSAARDLAEAKSLAFGGVGVAGLMSEGERNLRAVLQQPDASQQLQLRSLTRHRQASSIFWLGCADVIAPRIKRSLIRWLVLAMTLKLCADAWSARSPFVRSSHRFKMVDSMITCHGRHGDYQPLVLVKC
jgi:hypothetical protein